MKRLVISILILLFVSLSLRSISAAGKEIPMETFEQIVNDMVKAINEEDHKGIQKDFSPLMLKEFPLEKSRPFFTNLLAQYGKFQKLDSGQLFDGNQAVFPAHFERGILDIKIVLDTRDKIIGLWFLPHTVGITAGAEKEAEPSETVAEANTVAEVNAVEAKLKEFGLEQELQRINEEAQYTMQQWTRIRAENRTGLARSAQEQAAAELNFVREVAVEEGAVKTAAAIDGLLLYRQRRFEEMMKKLEEAIQRLTEREERRKGRDDRRRRDSRRDQRRDRRQ